MVFDDHNAQGAEAVQERGTGRSRTGAVFRIESIQGLALQAAAYLALHQGQDQQCPDEDAQQACDPIGVLQKHRGNRQRALQVVETDRLNGLVMLSSV